jgi:hypothetical protein
VDHHPLLVLGVIWWAALAYTVNLDAGALWIGLAPTLAVIANYYLSGRRVKAIARSAKQQVGEVHELVNDRATQQDKKIAALEARLAESRGET